jgi:two-component system nitrogen regulation sensor histidine kinase NtrY
MNRKKALYIGILVASVFGFLLYMETQLPFFRKFLPVGENKLIIIILNINLLLILLLLFLVTRTLVKTKIEKKRGIWGSGLKTKLTLTLLFISIIPSVTLFVLTTGFFHLSMDRWFSAKIEDTIESSLQLSQFYYEDLLSRYEKTAKATAGEIEKQKLLYDRKGLEKHLARIMRTQFLDHFAVYSLTGEVIATNIPEDVSRKLAHKVTGGGGKTPMRLIIPEEEGELIVSGAPITDESGSIQAMLVIGESIEVRGTERIQEITSTRKEFTESRAYKKVLKYSFIIPMFLITIITIFFSIWVGIKMATEITVPIEKMKEGAAIIAKGKFDIDLEDRGKDEIGTLVTAFNSMARELKVAKEEVEEKRKYMEVILDNVATGIISTDKRGNILLLNRAARSILGVEREDLKGVPLKQVLGDEFKKLTRAFLKDVRETGEGNIAREMRIQLKKGVTYLRVSLTTLKDEENRREGFIIAFDDVTQVVRAEKLATWREIARKLTHEIKNPLTPIILSAERIRRKLLGRAEGEEKDVLDDTTSVIIKSVEDIKGIVNELNKLTHTAQTRVAEDLNAIVEETLALYRGLYTNISLQFQKEEIPPFLVDRDGIKRALINLITNSVKAMDGMQGLLSVVTRYDVERGLGIVEVADTGKGIPDEDKERVFEPYFTKEKAGTGLGLAIVHSIVLEHNGKIIVEDNHPTGTRFIIELPVIEA